MKSRKIQLTKTIRNYRNQYVCVFLVAEQSNGALIQMPMPAVPAQSSTIQSSDENQLGTAVRPINDQLPAGLVFAYCFFFFAHFAIWTIFFAFIQF